MRTHLRALALSMASVLTAGFSLAQQAATGALEGRVSSGGESLPDARVTLTSASLQGTRVALTGENGGFAFVFLSPGDYQLRIEREGFAEADARARVSIAETTRIDVELRPVARESITVAGDASTAAVGAAAATRFSTQELEQLPTSRDLRSMTLLSSAVRTLPGQRTIMISGAPSWDSLFLSDGVTVNEHLSGQPQDLVFEDAIQEIAILTSGISAEYGRFTGGVVSALTKSGGNTFAGSIRDTVTNDRWMSRTPWPGQKRAPSHLNHGVEATLGGYGVRDRLWFFAAGRRARTSLQLYTQLTNVPFRSVLDDDRLVAKVTAHPTTSHSLVVSYTAASPTDTNATQQRGLADFRATRNVSDLGALIPERSQPTSLLSASASGTVVANTFAELSYARKHHALRGNGGRSRDRILGTVILPGGGAGNLNAPLGCGICGDDRRESTTWAAKLVHYRNTAFGNHTLSIGGDAAGERRVNQGTRSSSDFTVQTNAVRIIGSTVYPIFDALTLIVWTPHFGGDRGSRMKSSSAYANDVWDLDGRGTLNLGIRYDGNNARDPIGRLISNDSAISPRAGLTWHLTSDGLHGLIASYGRYAARILEGGGNPQQIGVFDQFGWPYRGPAVNAAASGPLLTTDEALRALFAWFDAAGGTANPSFTVATSPSASGDFPRPLRSPSVEEWTLGYTRQFARGSLRAEYVDRNWRHFYANRLDTTTGQRVTPFGNTIDVVWVVNDDTETQRRYRALNVSGSWRRSRVTVAGNYALSSLRGNDEGEDGVGPSAPRNVPSRLFYPEYLSYEGRRPVGYLRQDQRHRGRAWVVIEGPLGRASLTLSLLQSFDSGTAYSAVGMIDPTGRATPYEGIPPNPGYALNMINTAPYYFSARGAFRTDNVWSTDVAVQARFALRGVELFTKVDALNVTGNAAVISPGMNVITARTGGAASGLQAFNPFSQRPVEGVHYRLSPTFGEPVGPESFQSPRTMRLAVGLRF